MPSPSSVNIWHVVEDVCWARLLYVQWPSINNKGRNNSNDKYIHLENHLQSIWDKQGATYVSISVSATPLAAILCLGTAGLRHLQEGADIRWVFRVDLGGNVGWT